MPGLPWSYTPSRRCGTSTGIDPSPIQRKLTSRLGSVGQHCPPVLGEGNGQRGTLMSDSHCCRAVTTSTSRIHIFIQVTPHSKQSAHTVEVVLSIIYSTRGQRWIKVGDRKEKQTGREHRKGSEEKRQSRMKRK
ncbi:hypothetical protein PoB_002721800 [Plakobranchus ocellatus]|uniref:Uncharacterized protein n=1 Tax=Plakobranchus ocellatus TaxID=259542 RepID=A0AAV4A0Q2_9GAST|nr:hypothetical protein PoB_002721800 [Plakobranchus ocellatus]